MLPRARSTLKDFGTTVSDKDAHNELLIFRRCSEMTKPKDDGRMGRIAVILAATQKQYGWMFLRTSDEG
jgi:hypothetical protein